MIRDNSPLKNYVIDINKNLSQTMRELSELIIIPHQPYPTAEDYQDVFEIIGQYLDLILKEKIFIEARELLKNKE